MFNPRKPHRNAEANFIFDTGSQQSYITTRFKDKFRLQTLTKRAVSIVTFGSQQDTTQRCDLVKLGVKVNEGKDMEVKLLTIPLICEPLVKPPVFQYLSQYHHLQHFKLADLGGDDHMDPDTLIGSDLY